MNTPPLGTVDAVIGKTAFRIAQRLIENAAGADQRFCLRVKNLKFDEIRVFLENWERDGIQDSSSAPRVVIAGDSQAHLPEQYRAEPGRSITYYRNNIQHGLIYLETKDESDAQGLKNIFTLRDSNFLDGSFDDSDFSVPRAIVEQAWIQSGGEILQLSGLLRDTLQEILSLVHPHHVPVSVRKFAAFALATCQEWRRGHTSVLEPGEVWELVGDQLDALDMFRDRAWRSPESSARISRRLKVNALHALSLIHI